MNQIRFETDCSDTGMHLHAEMEILYALQGRCAVFTGDRNFVLKLEDFAVFNPFESHQIYREESSHTLSFYIPMETLMQTKTAGIRCISPLQPEKKVNSDLLRMRLAEIFRDYTENPIGRQLNIQAALLELISILQQDFTDETNGCTAPQPSFFDKSRRRQDLLRYIWEHYTQPITLKQAAEHFYLSEGHFSRIFHEIAGEPFSSYLRKVRLLCAKQEMEQGNSSVTEIALSCGFGNVNTFIDAFRKEYGITPGVFLRSGKKTTFSAEASSSSHAKPSQTSAEKISYMSLLRYQAVEKKDHLLRQPTSEIIRADLTGRTAPFHPVWKKMIGGAYAKDILFEIVQRILSRSVAEIGFESFLLHGILNDELGVCQRVSDGSLKFNFAYMDIILDFLVEKLNITPWIFLDYTPRCLVSASELRMFGNHITSLPEDLNEWTQLVTAALKHMIHVYGEQRVSGWKFSIEQAMQVSVGNCGMEEYKAFWLASYRAIRSVLPHACILGFGLDTGFVTLPDRYELEELLLFAKENGCMPDILSFQCFFCDYSNPTHQQIDINSTENEVFPLSEDENLLSRELDRIEEITAGCGQKIPAAIIVSNPGMWGRNPGNDTCFQAAALIKHAVENRNRVIAFSAGGISDYPEKLLPVKSMYHGGSGLFTYNGIPKASYVSQQLLSGIKGEVIGEGDGYLLTCTSDRKHFYLLMYYYCPYHLARHRTTALSPAEERYYDRYYEFEDMGAKAIHIYLKGLLVGKYLLETHYVNRESGSSYDIWMKMGAPEQMKQPLLDYLERRSVPELYIDSVNVKEDEETVMSVFLEPHEVRVIHGVYEEN